MDEFEIIRRYFASDSVGDSVLVGIGDDGAVLRADENRDLVTVVDTLVADVHFPQEMRPADIAYRAVAVNISDIAAMGARARWMTLALTLADTSDDWLASFAAGLRAAAQTFHVELVGGDTTRGRECVVTVQVTGDVEHGKAISRSGAQPGDSIYVSGYPGDAACGLELLQNDMGENNRSETDDYLIARFARPDARPDLGLSLVNIATAAIDVSDGLFGDLAKVLAASNVGGHIELLDIPLSQQLKTLKSWDEAIALALGGGDDYELCFTAPQNVIDGMNLRVDVPITRIGWVHAEPGLFCTRDGNRFDYHDEGYRHFSE